MIHSVSRETLEKANRIFGEHEQSLNEYIDQLIWWNKRLNLVSRSVSRETLILHVLHSLLPAAMGLLDTESHWVDAGTGGGLPGLPLAVICPEKRWTMNDRSQKKMTAVKQMIHSLGLPNADVEPGSIGDLNWAGQAGVVTKHAFPVDRLLPLIGGKSWQRLIMYKGVSEPDVLQVLECPNGMDVGMYPFEFGDEPFFRDKGVLRIDSSIHR